MSANNVQPSKHSEPRPKSQERSDDAFFFTEKDLIRRFKYSSANLRKMRRDGFGPPYFQPKGPRTKVLYPCDEFFAWVKSDIQYPKPAVKR